ncbi:MAG: hypothetical protein ACUVSL_11725, partial [Chloroflexus sp.]|uniref:hypothetical protein n=1 Tax=Chloroflexus sp. TaxID=1904827 RepID=UPI004049F3F0
MLIERVKTLLSVLVICLAPLSTVGFISFPLEAGAVLISLAVVIFSWQLIRYPEIILPKSVVIVWIFGLYTMLIKPFSSRVPSNDYTVFIIFLLSLYILIIYASLRKDIAPRIWENSLIIIALVISLFELREILIYYNQYLSTINQITVVRNLVSTFRVSGFLFMHPNVLAGFINLVWPIIVVRIVKTPTKVEKGLWFLAFFFIGLVFLFTISRGGTIGAIFGSVVLVFRYCQTSFDRRAMLPLLRYFLNW